MLTKKIDQMIEETQAHIEADQVKAGGYWDDKTKKGGFIGGLTHSDRACMVTELYGIPLPLVLILGELFKQLSEKNTGDGIEFFGSIPAAIAIDNKDLSKVHWKFLKDCLEHLPEQDDSIQAVIDPVIEGLGFLSEGKDWPHADRATDAASAALADAYDDATYAADDADDAYATVDAYAAAYAAADAARAAAYAYAPHAYATRVALATVNAAHAIAYPATYAAVSETKRQAEVLLKLIKHAPVKESA